MSDHEQPKLPVEPHVLVETVVLVECSCGLICDGLSPEQARATWEAHVDEEVVG